MSVPLIGVGVRETRVKLKLVLDTDTNKVSVEVAVGSVAKPNAWSSSSTPADDESTLIYRCSKIAETLAEFQCRSYGDMHDPRSCGKAAEAACRDIMRQAARATTRVKPGVTLRDEAERT